MRETLLEVKNLNMHFASGRGKDKITVKAVNDVSFSVYKAETFGLVGESGCGKTTTGRCIIRLYNPTSGSITCDGREISGPMSRDLRKYISQNISMVFQDPVESLNPRMTIEEIVSEGLRVKTDMKESEIRQEVYKMLDRVGLTQEHATRYPHEFSGGQRQRVGIARAIITRPRCIIADEPVSALDVSIRSQVINLLNELKQEMGLTILFVAHDLSLVKYFSDRVGVMYFGKLVELADGDSLYRWPVHPYTRSLLSAIPQPNPLTEKKRSRLVYEPDKNTPDDPTRMMREVEDGHFVYATEQELELYKNGGGL